MFPWDPAPHDLFSRFVYNLEDDGKMLEGCWEVCTTTVLECFLCHVQTAAIFNHINTRIECRCPTRARPGLLPLALRDL